MTHVTYRTIRHTTVTTKRAPAKPRKAPASPALARQGRGRNRDRDPRYAVYEIVQDGDITLFDALLPANLQALLSKLSALQPGTVYERFGKPAARNGVLITLAPWLANLFAQLCDDHNAQIPD